MNTAAASGGILSIIIIIAAFMAIFIPFWVFRIRNEIIRTNRKIDAIIDLLGGNSAKLNKLSIGTARKPTKTCPYCHSENRMQDINCISCGKTI